MKNKHLKPVASVAALVLGMAFVSLFANIEAAAQENIFGTKPLIKESQKTDRNEQVREELIELDRLIEREPRNVLAYQMRASHHYELEQYEQAIADHSRVIALQPDSFKPYVERASVYHKLEQYDKALADLDYVISRAPRHSDTRGYDAYDALTWRYLIHLVLHEDEKALADLTSILEFRPKDEAIYQLRSNLYKTTKQYEKAIADYTELIKINSRSTWGYLGRAEVYKITDKPQKAAADIKAADKIVKERGF